MKRISALTLVALCAALLTACGSNNEHNAAACQNFAAKFNDHDVNNNLAYAVDDNQRERLFAGVEDLIPVIDNDVEKTSGDVKKSLTHFREAGDYFLHPERGGSQLDHFGLMLDATHDLTDACTAAGSPLNLIPEQK